LRDVNDALASIMPFDTTMLAENV